MASNNLNTVWLAYHGKTEISLSIRDGIVDQGNILRHAGGLVDQRRVSGSILGLETFNGGDITGVSQTTIVCSLSWSS
jgi:hypothetical protein